MNFRLSVAALLIGIVGWSTTAHARGNAEQGKQVVDTLGCAGCHGPDLSSPTDPTYPKLAGQHYDYLVQALRAYQRADGPNGRANPIMAGFAAQLSAQDIQNVAAYVAGLRGALVVKR